VLTLLGGWKNMLGDCMKPADGLTTFTNLHLLLGAGTPMEDDSKTYSIRSSCHASHLGI